MRTPVSKELARLGRAWARTEGRRAGRRVAILALLAFLVACAVHRLGSGLPVLSRVESRPLEAVGLVLAAFALAWLAERLVALDQRPAMRALARRLDDALGLADGTDSALSAASASPSGATAGLALGGSLAPLVEQRAAARLAGLDPKELWRGPPGRSRIPLLLALGALFLLLAPGVLGIGGSRGSGHGDDFGAGRRPTNPRPFAGAKLTPEDADQWLAAHGRVTLEVPDPKGKWNHWVARFQTDAALPEPYRSEILVEVDGSGPLPLPEPRSDDRVMDAMPGLVANMPVPFVADHDAATKEKLTKGRHEVRVHLRPIDGPWRVVLKSPPIEVIVPPPDDGGGGGMDDNPPKPNPPPPPPSPTPQPPPPPKPPPPPLTPPPPTPPRPPPPPDQGPAAPPPDALFHDEAVQPLVREGETVHKEKAVVAVRDPNAGSAAPRVVPVDEALKDFDRVVESAVASERILPADKALVRRYFEALRRMTGAAAPAPAAPPSPSVTPGK